MQIVTIATIGLIGTSADAVRLLNERGLLDEFSSNFRSSAGHIKVGYLQSLSQLFAVHALQETNSDIEKITGALFHNMGGKIITFPLLLHSSFSFYAV
jgi:hypothetical protein